MSYVEILILRHLRVRPAHGYELRKRVEATTGFVLHNNSLYPALKRFEEAGAVVKRAQTQEGRPPKHVYELTDVGWEMLHDMIAELPPDAAGDDTEFLARVGQFALVTAEERTAVLDARDDALRRRIEHLEVMAERAAGERWALLVTGELLRRTRLERQWLVELRSAAQTGETETGQ